MLSVYELHTDIIVKGSRKSLFGHKISLARGKSNLILDCDVLRGNPSDKMLYKPTIERIQDNYNIIPRNSSVMEDMRTKKILITVKEKES